MPSIRLSFILVSAACVFAMAVGLVMQYMFDMAPCALCISQRVFIILAGFAAAAGAIFANSKLGAGIASVLGSLFVIIGAGVSARHVWIQNLPEEEVPLCGPGLSYMFETRPMFDALSVLFSGDGHCADINFSFLGLTIPGWTLVFFVGLLAFLIYAGWRNFKSAK